MFNFRFLADKIFHQPKQKIFAGAAADTTNRDKLVIGVAKGNEAKAYPIEIIGYHHQVYDTIFRDPIIVTYCTVCRTGRVFNPLVNGNMKSSGWSGWIISMPCSKMPLLKAGGSNPPAQR
jgi:hypothetical protein